MIGAGIVYGISLTGEFGDPDDVNLPPVLRAWADTLEDRDTRKKCPQVVSQATVENHWIVAGFYVDADQLDDPAYVSTLRPWWEASMADLPADIRDALLAFAPPKVQMIYGEY